MLFIYTDAFRGDVRGVYILVHEHTETERKRCRNQNDKYYKRCTCQFQQKK
jgi:hypothetical protein